MNTSKELTNEVKKAQITQRIEELKKSKKKNINIQLPRETVIDLLSLEQERPGFIGRALNNQFKNDFGGVF